MIAGVATVTIVVSTRIMKKPRHSAKSAGHGPHVGGVGPVCCHDSSQHSPTDDDSSAALDWGT